MIPVWVTWLVLAFAVGTFVANVVLARRVLHRLRHASELEAQAEALQAAAADLWELHRTLCALAFGNRYAPLWRAYANAMGGSVMVQLMFPHGSLEIELPPEQEAAHG